MRCPKRRWADIDTEASIPEAALNFDVAIDPMVYTIALGWKFWIYRSFG